MQAPKSGMMPLKTGILYRGSAFRVHPGRWEQTCIRFSLGRSGCRRRGRLGARAPTAAGDDALGLIHGGFVLAFAHILLKPNTLVAKPVGDLVERAEAAHGGATNVHQPCGGKTNTIKRLYRSLFCPPPTQRSAFFTSSLPHISVTLRP